MDVRRLSPRNPNGSVSFAVARLCRTLTDPIVVHTCIPLSSIRSAVGSLCEYMAHECARSSLAFYKPAVAAASRRPARADGPKVGLDGPAPWRRASSVERWAGSATSAPEAQRQCLSRRLTIARCPAHAERRRPSDC